MSGKEEMVLNEVEPNVADERNMLANAEEHIAKLECQLKEKYAEIEFHVRRADFYEQIVKNLTTFKR